MVVRGIIAAAFTAGILVWPDSPAVTLAALFGGYAVLDGLTAIVVAIVAYEVPGFRWLLAQGGVSLALGTWVVLNQGMQDATLLRMIAWWAIVTGAGAVVTASTPRGEVSGEWPVPFTGALSLVMGVLLLLSAQSDVTTIRWIVASYGLLTGVTHVALGIRLRQLVQEIPRS